MYDSICNSYFFNDKEYRMVNTHRNSYNLKQVQIKASCPGESVNCVSYCIYFRSLLPNFAKTFYQIRIYRDTRSYFLPAKSIFQKKIVYSASKSSFTLLYRQIAREPRRKKRPDNSVAVSRFLAFVWCGHNRTGLFHSELRIDRSFTVYRLTRLLSRLRIFMENVIGLSKERGRRVHGGENIVGTAA